jgi:hypothetical protein
MALARRLSVAPPARMPNPYGLLAVVQTRDDTDPHWRAGVKWQDFCDAGGTTYDLCVAQSNNLPVTGVASKAATNTLGIYGATAFDVYTEVDCSAPGFWDNPERTPAQLIERVLVENESFQVERAFWTGTAAGQTVVYPHLAATTALVDSGAGLAGTTLQMAATQLNSGTPLDQVEAMAVLEAAMAACMNTVGVIHMPIALIPIMAQWNQIVRDGPRYRTFNGNLVAAGYGYPGTSPAGAVTSNALWMFGTGPVFAYRGGISVLGRPVEQFDRSVNTMKVIAERPWLFGYDCCLIGVAVTTGGAIAGTAGAAT